MISGQGVTNIYDFIKGPAAAAKVSKSAMEALSDLGNQHQQGHSTSKVLSIISDVDVTLGQPILILFTAGKNIQEE